MSSKWFKDFQKRQKEQQRRMAMGYWQQQQKGKTGYLSTPLPRGTTIQPQTCPLHKNMDAMLNMLLKEVRALRKEVEGLKKAARRRSTS